MKLSRLIFSFCLLLPLGFSSVVTAQSISQQLPFPIGESSLLSLFNKPIVFTEAEGFPLQHTNTITEDDQGFIWIGGLGGLVRFDGISFTPIPLCVEGNEQWHIRDLLFDSEEQQLWIATWGYGLLKLELNTYTCTQVYSGTTHQDKHLYWIHKAADALWLGKKKGITALPFDRDTVLDFSYTVRPQEEEQLAVNRVNNLISHQKDIVEDSLLWIGTVDGLLRFNLYSHQFKRYSYDPGTRDYPLVNSIRTIYQEHDGQLLLGTWGGGVLRFDPADGSFDRPAKRTADFGNTITSIVSGSDGQLLVHSTDGLQKLDPDSWAMGDRLENDFEKNLIYGCKFIDKAGRIFTGRWNNLVLYDPLLQQFPLYQLPSELVAGIGNEVKRVIGPDPNQVLWITVYKGKGIYRYNLENGTWSVIKVAGKNVYSPVFSSFLRNGNQLHLSNESQFHEFDPATFEVDMKIIWDDPSLIASNFLEHSDGSYWFSTQNHGLVRWQPEEQIRYMDELRHPSFPDHPLSLSDLEEDSLGNIWINSITGYSVYDYRRDTFFNFPYLLPDTTKLVDLNHIVQDKKGGIWLLSYGHGFMKVDPEHPERRGVFLFDDLIESNFQSGRIDQQGRIWLFSEQGLECFDPQKGASHFMENVYGLPDRLTGMGLLEDGRLYLGQPGGFQLFDPDSLQKNAIRPIPYISGFSVFDQPLATELPVHRLQELTLSPRQNFFSIQFSNINFTLPQRDSFAYQLEGIDPDWVYTQDRREVFYTDVPSGDYIFRLKSANSEGNWNTEIKTLAIHIATPWWKTTWAILAYLLLSGYLFYRLYRFHLSRRLALLESKRLQELHEWKNNFYINIAHEFRTPLTVISGITNEIKGHEKEKALIQRNSQRLLKMVNQILSLRKLESKHMELQSSPGDIARFLSYLSYSFQSLAHRKHLRLTYYADPESIPMAFDKEKMQQIVANLISNAIQFTPEYGKVEVGLSLLDNGRQIQLKVRDSGVGIPADHLDHIFDRFHQAENQEVRTGGGSGIGLALVKELVNLMKGSIEVKSEAGQGTTFIMLLPRIAAKLPEENTPYATNKKTRTTKERGYILLLEDDLDVASYLQSILQDQYRIDLAHNGREGLERAFREVPDIVISDVMMPEMDGFAFCTALKKDERTSHIPVIFLTAKATQEERLQGLKTGADAYLTKPFDKEELLIRLEKLLELRKEMQLHFRKKDVPDYQDPFLRKLQQVVEENLDDENFGTLQLCRAMAMSRTQLHRKIKALLDIPTARFIQLTRLHHARQLILTTDKSIGEISYEAGFKDPSYFTKLYVAEFEEKPSDTRK